MSEMNPENKPTTTPDVFVPKMDNTIALTLDESVSLVKKLQAEKLKLEKQIDNLKEVAKTHMKARNLEEYITPTGIKARWSESQRCSVDKELAKELLGPNWARVESFDTVRSFTIK